MDPAAVPVHLAIIPDGNRRWAKQRGLPSLEGHRRGLNAAKNTARAAFDRGVRYFTMYAFSVENWRRTEEEVGYLMDLFHNLITREFQELEERGVRFQFLGMRDGLPAKLLAAIDDAEIKTRHHTKGTLGICLNYSGQFELADAFRGLLKSRVAAEDVTPQVIADHLYGPEMPPIDLVIRSSGERRISGFMLWRVAYAEFYFVEKHWPDFSEADLDEALEEFANRQRRYGK